MALSDERLNELAKKLAARIREVESEAKPKLRLVDLPAKAPAETGMDAITREAHCRRIRYLARAYRLQWLVDQSVFDHAGVESLSDEQLIQLHSDLEKARECPVEDVSYEERGLVRKRV